MIHTFPNRLSISLLALHWLRWSFWVRQLGAVAASAPGAAPTRLSQSTFREKFLRRQRVREALNNA
ncbi:hypothetical protein, partial [Xanthomonas hortorum]|uniref:hypothetical protein n=1 Tax=Xanthomonas hortorum TaxID=56454 RepID=UPI00204450E7